MNTTFASVGPALGRKSLTLSLTRLIENACRAERAASGFHRRGAFRDTRFIIGAVIAHGFAPHDVAKIIGVKVDSVLTRKQANGRLAVTSARALMEMGEQELAAMSLIVYPGDEFSAPFYRTADLIPYLCTRDDRRA